MQTLSHSLRNLGQEGEPLPTVFSQLERQGFHFRRGWVHLIAGAPGCGKSALSTFLSLSLQYPDGPQVPGLYFSPDNDKMTWGKAAIAKAKNIHVNQAEKMLSDNNPDAWEALSATSNHLWISFQASPTPADIREEIDAFAYVYGDWPHCIWIDNIMDVDASAGADDDKSGQEAVLIYLRKLARDHGIAVFVLGHVTGMYTDGTQPIPRSGLMNKIDKIPQAILTLWRPEENQLGYCIVKNRGGRACAAATYGGTIPWIPEMGFFGTGRGPNQ